MRYERRLNSIINLAKKTGYLTDAEKDLICIGTMLGMADICCSHTLKKSPGDEELRAMFNLIGMTSDILWQGDSLSYKNLIKVFGVATVVVGPEMERETKGKKS